MSGEQRLELNGYGTRVTLLEGTLRVEATSFVGKGALGGSEREIPVGQIQAITYREPSLLANGQIRIRSDVGLTLIHFLKKSAPQARALFQATLAQSHASPEALPTGPLANEAMDAFSARITARLEAWQDRLQEAQRVRDEEFAGWRARNRESRDQLRMMLVTPGGNTRRLSSELTVIARVLEAAERELVPDVPEVSDDDLAADDAASAAPVPPVSQRVEKLLDLAEQAVIAGDVQLEELRIAQAITYATKIGNRLDRVNADRAIQARESRGKIRVGSQLLGEVRAESGIGQWARKGSLASIVTGEKRIVVRTDRVTVGAVVRAIDEFTSAQVYLDGQVQITQRPTLTRMLLLSPLPGSAIIPGLALQKRTTHDSRTAEFQIGSIGWSFRVPLDPNNVNAARQLAEQANRAAGALEKQSPPPTQSADALNTTLDQLERLAFLADKGLLTPEEVGRLRAAMLG